VVEWLTPEEKLAKVSKFFDTVSNPNSPRPVTAEELPIDEIIDLLRSSGIDFGHNRQKVWVEVISLLFDFDKTVKIVL